MGKMTRLVSWALSAALVAVAAPAAVSGGQPVRISANDNGGEVTIARDGHVEVRLETAGATGYLWEFECLDTDLLEVVGERTTAADTAHGLTGGPVAQVWTLRAKAPGRTEIRVILRRPWEGKEKAVDAFSVKLSIVP